MTSPASETASDPQTKVPAVRLILKAAKTLSETGSRQLSLQFSDRAANGFVPQGSRAWTRLRTRAGMSVMLTLLVFGAVWLSTLARLSLSPPPDNIEQLVWVHSIEGGY